MTVFLSGGAVATDHSKLDKYLTQIAENEKAMLSVAIRQDGQLVYQKELGFSDEGKKKPITEKSMFRIGSITKTYTAVLVLKLVEQGKVKLAQKLSDFFPEVPNSSGITLEQMLRHESGIFSITEQADFMSYMYESKTRSELVKIITSVKPKFKPGTEQEYSNSNFILLGMIAEKVSGKTLAQLIDDEIIKPLGHSSSYLGQSSEIKPSEVTSFRYQGSWQAIPNSDLSIPSGAGAMIANADEVSSFMSALFSGKLLSAQSLELMTDVEGAYGLGLMAFPFYDRRALGHGGAIDGFLANAVYFEEDKVAVAVLSNAVNFDFNSILIAILSAQFERDFDIPEFTTKQVQLSVEESKAYTGEFDSKQLPLDITVFIEEEKLMAQATGQGAFELTAYAEHEFRFDTAGITFLYKPDKQSFTLIQGGGKYLFERK